MRSPPGRALLTREPIRITDIRQTEEFDYSDLLREHGVISLVNVPIAWDGHTYGVLEIDSRSFTDFLDDTIHFLHGFANFLAAAIQRKRQEEEREILFRELQHRIKNSLQIIGALLRIEQRKGDLNGFNRVDEAVQAISLAYDQLTGSREIKRVRLDRYLGGLCGVIMPNMIGPRPVQVASDIEPVSLDFDKAVVLGLITNELVTNSVKHAFSADASGLIRVLFHVEEGEGILVVEDDGRGTGTGDQASGDGFSVVDGHGSPDWWCSGIGHGTPAGHAAHSAVPARWAVEKGGHGFAAARHIQPNRTTSTRVWRLPHWSFIGIRSQLG